MTAQVQGRWLAAAAGVLLAVAAVATGFVLRESGGQSPPRAGGEHSQLLLLTSLPIVFPESFTLDADESPVLEALGAGYEIVPISVSDSESLQGAHLLLMAQPRAQPAEALVELDSWVRSGGRLLLLADPALEWRSERPLGDPLRPPSAFADTGLLGHWGLRLDSPDRPGPATATVADESVRTVSPGSLVATGEDCRVSGNGLIARCRIGRGWATVVADADFLDSERFGRANLDLLLAELKRLDR